MFKLVSSLTLVRDLLNRAYSILVSNNDGGWARGSAFALRTGRLVNAKPGDDLVQIVIGYCATQAITEAMVRWTQELISYGAKPVLHTVSESGEYALTMAGQDAFNDAVKVLAVPLGYNPNTYYSNPVSLVQGFNDAGERTKPEVVNLFRFGLNMLDGEAIFTQIAAEPVAVVSGESATEAVESESDSESD